MQSCLAATLDIKNAFNTASWDKIVRATFGIECFTLDGVKTHHVSAGVPLGYVLDFYYGTSCMTESCGCFFPQDLT